MDPRSPSANDGVGQHPRRSSQDDGSRQPRSLQAHDGTPETCFSPEVLALEQLRITGNHNEYTEGPTIAHRSLLSQHRHKKRDPVTMPVSSTEQETREERPSDVPNLHANSSVMRSSSVEDSHSSTRTSMESTCSDQRLLAIPACGDQIISNQPKRAALMSNKKTAHEEPRLLVAMPGTGGRKRGGVHSKCEHCGLCRCLECRHPRALPSCWMCGRRFLCSAQHAVEYCTCVCCVKGLFYHCSSDDEDTCTDKPFSCTQSHCCFRWTTVSLIGMILPCLLCYLPARGCVTMCQNCYDQATRPGCRCKNTIHCEAACKPT
uniref:protein sprouty homolog 2 n=1 Tax=Doryrhamphus excisus TaxID=161450 RepID=UPI0025ADD21B|nr:protein sprouty homolog 2 [Doryrhamphus excisus]